MKQLLAILVGVLLAALVVVGVVYYWREPAPPPMHITREPVDEAPPEVVQSPYRNAQPGVKYVGDAACADCHVQETRSYMKHPMSRSLAPVADLLDRERVDAKAHNPFKAIGFKMRVERRGKQLVHVEAYEDE